MQNDTNQIALPLPDSSGWWWCRTKKSYQPGDELCVEVAMQGDGAIIVHSGRDYDFIRPADPIRGIPEWFHDLEWIKAESPWDPDSPPEPPWPPTWAEFVLFISLALALAIAIYLIRLILR